MTVTGQLARVTTVARGGVAIVFHVPPSEASHALAAGKFAESAMKMELTIIEDEDVD